jgi:hypothetical protein
LANPAFSSRSPSNSSASAICFSRCESVIDRILLNAEGDFYGQFNHGRI